MIRAFSIVSRVVTETETGTSCSVCSRLVAVMTTRSIFSAAGAFSTGGGVGTWPVTVGETTNPAYTSPEAKALRMSCLL